MSIPSIRFSFCTASQEREAKYSPILRIVVIGLGIIAMLTGIFILCNIPGLSSLGTTAGSIFFVAGILMLSAAACLRCIETSDQQNFEHFTQIETQVDFKRDVITDKASKGSSDQIKDQNNVALDFAKITPANYEQYLDVSQTLDLVTAKKGDLTFAKEVDTEGNVLYLLGMVQNEGKGWYLDASLQICNGEFVHYTQQGALGARFSNLKDFFNYMFQGNLYQGACVRGGSLGS